MKIITGLIFAIFVSACAQKAGNFSRSPALQAQSEALIGEPIYKVSATGGSMDDYYSGNSYGGEGVSFQIIYSGVANGQLRLVYREFQKSAGAGSNSRVRPAFDQELTYDFVPGMQVTVKTALITVYGANQQKIIYAISRGFKEEVGMEALAKCGSLDTGCSNRAYEMIDADRGF